MKFLTKILKQINVLIISFYFIIFPIFSQGASFQDPKKNPKETTNSENSKPNSSTSSPKEEVKKYKKNSLNLSKEQIDKKKEEIIKVLKYGTNANRKTALNSVHYFDLEESDELLKLISEIAISDLNNEVKIACINTLVEIDPPSEYETIIKTLQDPANDVKEAGINAIQKLKIDAATDELVSLLKNINLQRNNNLAVLVISTVGRLKSGKNAFSFLLSKFQEKNTSSSIKAHIALYFGKVKDIKSEDALIKIAADESEDIVLRSYCISSLGKLKSKKAIEIIKSILKKINDNKSNIDRKKLASLRTYAITALVNLGDREVLKELIAYARDDDPKIRIGALKKLAEIDDPFIVELIKYKAVKDPNQKVQGVARKILKDLKSKPTTEMEIDEKEIKELLESSPQVKEDTKPAEAEKEKSRNRSRNNYPNTSE
ncbi:MAG: HEAT repeat domain-containing protein [Leptospiraceae bacterium]|nr:HEAT repeat domain-containing protein [Leptospiraceae bacterium]MCP5497467.1 HEAT repeat domain-containing protein [Leptospiraceae bacterium]